MNEERLRLKASDDEDLEVFAGLLQDAPMPLTEVTHMADERCFAALFRRYLYENLNENSSAEDLQEIDCALVFEGVTSAQAWDIGGLGGRGSVELMTIVSEEIPGGVSVTLVFHGGGHIRLETGAIQGRLVDIGEPTKAARRPRHSPLFDR